MISSSPNYTRLVQKIHTHTHCETDMCISVSHTLLSFVPRNCFLVKKNRQVEYLSLVYIQKGVKCV